MALECFKRPRKLQTAAQALDQVAPPRPLCHDSDPPRVSGLSQIQHSLGLSRTDSPNRRSLDQPVEAAHPSPMTKLQPARAETTEAFMAQAGPQLAALCTACGACFEACPMVDHIGLRAVDAKAVTHGLRGLARGETA